MPKHVLSKAEMEIALERETKLRKQLEKALKEAKAKIATGLDTTQEGITSGTVTSPRQPVPLLTRRATTASPSPLRRVQTSLSSSPSPRSTSTQRSANGFEPRYARPTESSSRRSSIMAVDKTGPATTLGPATPTNNPMYGYRDGELIHLRRFQSSTSSSRAKNSKGWWRDWGAIEWEYTPTFTYPPRKTQPSTREDRREALDITGDSDDEDPAADDEDDIETPVTEPQFSTPMEIWSRDDPITPELNEIFVRGDAAFEMIRQALQPASKATWHLLRQWYPRTQTYNFPQGPYQIKFGREEIEDIWFCDSTALADRFYHVRMDMRGLTGLRNDVCHPPKSYLRASWYRWNISAVEKHCRGDPERRERAYELKLQLRDLALETVQEVLDLMFLAELPFACPYPLLANYQCAMRRTPRGSAITWLL